MKMRKARYGYKLSSNNKKGFFHLSIGEDVGHDGQGRDEADAHVPPEVRQELIQWISELKK